MRVFTEGVFDCFHANHVRFLERAKAFGDTLIVGVQPDAEAMKYKRRPIMTEDERLAVVRAIGIVDEALLIPTTMERGIDKPMVEALSIDLVVYGGEGFDDYFAYPIQQGILRRIPYSGGISSSEVIRRVLELHGGQGSLEHD